MCTRKRCELEREACALDKSPSEVHCFGMDWSIFFVSVVTSALVVYPGFEFFQNLSIRAGQIPPRGVQTWYGREFLHWDRFATLLYGDLIFLSLINGFAISALSGMSPDIRIICASIACAVVITLIWWIIVREAFINRAIDRWDMGFTAPDAKLTIFGLFHLVYFSFEIALILVAAFYLLQPSVAFVVRAGLILSMLGYIVTVLYDIRTIGLYFGALGRLIQGQNNKS